MCLLVSFVALRPKPQLRPWRDGDVKCITCCYLNAGLWQDHVDSQLTCWIVTSC